MKTSFKIGAILLLPFYLVAQGQDQTPIFKLDDYRIQSIAISPDSKTVAIVGESSDVTLWDLATRKKKMTLRRELLTRKADALDIAKLMNSQGKVEGFEDDGMDGMMAFAVSTPQRSFFSASGEQLFICHGDGLVVWDAKNAVPKLEVFAKPDYYDVSPDTRNVAFIEAARVKEEPFHPARINDPGRTFRDTLILYSTVDNKKRSIELKSRSETKRIRFIPGSNNIIVLGMTGDLTIIDFNSGKTLEKTLVYKSDQDDDPGYVSEIVEMSASTSVSIAIHPNLPLIAFADMDQHLLLYDFKNHQIQQTIQLKDTVQIGQYFEQIRFTPDGKTLFGVRLNWSGEDFYKTLYFWDINTGKARKIIKTAAGGVDFFFSPDGRRFLLTKTDFQKKTPVVEVSVFDSSTFTKLESFQGKGPIAFFPNDVNRLLYTIGTFINNSGIGTYSIKK